MRLHTPQERTGVWAFRTGPRRVCGYKLGRKCGTPYLFWGVEEGGPRHFAASKVRLATNNSCSEEPFGVRVTTERSTGVRSVELSWEAFWSAGCGRFCDPGFQPVLLI